MQANITCKLCGREPKSYNSCSKLNLKFFVDCPICGKYYITDRAEGCTDDPKVKEKLYLVSAVIRQRSENNYAEPFLVTEELLTNEAEFQAKILSIAPRTVLDKAALLLQYIARKSSHPGDRVVIIPAQDYTVCFCKNAEELRFYINSLKEIGDIRVEGTMRDRDWDLSLTAEGWQKIESMERPNLGSKQAFVAMWFDETMDEIFKNGIIPIEKDTGFSMFRVDKTHFINEKICDKIIAEIRKSRFLIADVTGQRQAVYFEAGYAMGMGLPIIWTCKESEIPKCCFDTRQYPHIIWKDAEDLRNQLKEKILATIGKAHN